MAKVTARNADGQEVAVHQVQFNNLGEVESFLTTLTSGHKAWVHARDYDIDVIEGADQEFEQPGVMTKDTALKPHEQINKAAPLNESGEPEITPPPAAPVAAAPTTPTAPVVPAAPAASDNPGVLDSTDLGLGDDTIVPPVEPPAAVPPVEPPVAPTTPPADQVDEPIKVDPAQDSGIISEGDLPPTSTSNPRPPRPNVS